MENLKNTQEHYPKFSFRISQENLDFLNKTSSELNMSKSKILNFLLENHLREVSTNQHYEFDSFAPRERVVKVFLTNEEYDILKKSSIQNLRGSVQNELKFYAFNALSSDKIYDYKEIEELTKTRRELNKVGINLNQIARVLNAQNDQSIFSIEQEKNLREILQELLVFYQKLSQNIKAVFAKRF